MTKRTRTRQPKPPPQPEASKVDLSADQLAVLWTRLLQATGRDASGLGRSDGRSSGPNVHAAVVNVDVVEALVRIRSELAELVPQVERLLGLDRLRFDVLDLVGHLGDWHRALEARNQPLADDLEHDVRRWESIARRALGLDTSGRDLGELCPFHRDTAPTMLVVDPDRATLHSDLIAGRQPRVVGADGKAQPDAPLTWRYSDQVSCTNCRRSWSGLQELRVLGNLLRRANTSPNPKESEPA